MGILIDKKVETNLLVLNKLIHKDIYIPTLLSEITFKVFSRLTRSFTHFFIFTYNANYGRKTRNHPIDIR